MLFTADAHDGNGGLLTHQLYMQIIKACQDWDRDESYGVAIDDTFTVSTRRVAERATVSALLQNYPSNYAHFTLVNFGTNTVALKRIAKPAPDTRESPEVDDAIDAVMAIARPTSDPEAMHAAAQAAMAIDPYPVRFLPGQEPYTPAQWAQHQALVRDAAEIMEHFTSEELNEIDLQAYYRAQEAKANGA